MTCKTSMLILLALALLAASSAHAQTTSAGPYYATPSWDQILPASTRFVVLSNWMDAAYPSGGAAVLDRETGLVWERSPTHPSATWFDASTHCNQTVTGGRLGWRLPTIQEINSLNDPNVTTFPFLPAGHPFVLGAGALTFWSSTLGTSTFDEAWVGNFVIGSNPRAHVQTKAGISGGAWCVRGGAGSDVQ